MHLPREQISLLYSQLVQTTHPSSTPVLILTSLTVDSLCATRILTSLLKRDFIAHTIIPISGYSDLQRAGATLVLPLAKQRGGDGGTVICLGLGGAVPLEQILGLDGINEDGVQDVDMDNHGVEVWIIDAHRPWNLGNIFGESSLALNEEGDGVVRPQRRGVKDARLMPTYKPGRGGIIVWDDGNLEADLHAEKEAYFGLQGMPDITKDDLAMSSEDEGDGQDENAEQDLESTGQKRKRSGSLGESETDEGTDDEEFRPKQRRRSNSSSALPIPSSPGGNPRSAQIDIASTPPPMPSTPSQKEPSQRQLKKQLLKLRRKHEATLEKYYNLGTADAEPISSILYSLASEMGREDNELLWLAIVGITSSSISPSGPGSRVNQIQEVLRDEVRRLNPIPEAELLRSQNSETIIPTAARSPTDTSIKLSPEPRFFLIRHWSLYDSMLHSPYLATRLHIWSDAGRKRLHKLLAKMGISLQEASKGYLHMDSELKRTLRRRLLKFAPQYNLDGLVPGDNGRSGMEGWGFVRSWGWRGTLSAEDVAIVVGAILEVGTDPATLTDIQHRSRQGGGTNYNARIQNLPTPPHSSDDGHEGETGAAEVPDYVTRRFFNAYDSLAPTSGLATLLHNVSTAQNLYKAILRVGSALISKKQIRHLRAFRMGVVKEGPDVPLFNHPGALVRLAAWVSEAVAVLETEKGKRPGKDGDDALVLGALDDRRGVYIVVGLGGGNGWGRHGKKFRSKAELKEREERKKQKAIEKATRKAEAARKREERRILRRERNEANGIMESDDENSESEIETESASSSNSSNSDGDSDSSGDDMQRKRKTIGRNRFGQAFQEVVEETGARVRIDSFEHSVVEVKKEDFSGFLEALSLKTVVG